MLVVELADLDRVALPDLRPQRLGLLPAVVADHRVGGIEDRLRRAVVLLELDDVGVGERVLELEDVRDVGAPEPVDRLGIVADDHQVAVLAGEQLQPAVLGVVGVLVLVDEDVAKAVGVALADLGEQLEHVDGAHEQVVEVHRVHAVQLALVGAVDVGDRLLEERADHLAVGLGVAQLVLGVGDLAADRGRGEALGVDPELVEAALDQPAGVGGVVDRELARVAQALGLGAQHPGARRVEGHHPHRADLAADQQAGAVAHLPRRLVRERDRQDLVGLGDAGGHQVGDPVGEHPGLARARSGEDQLRPLAVADGLPLRVVEARQQGVEVASQFSHLSLFDVSVQGGILDVRLRRRRIPIEEGAIAVHAEDVMPSVVAEQPSADSPPEERAAGCSRVGRRPRVPDRPMGVVRRRRRLRG